MIDIHTHILPGVDDGAQTLEEAKAMLEMAAGDGTTTMVATPHADMRYHFDSQAWSAAAEQLRSVAPTRLSICSGSEVHLTPENIRSVVQAPASYALNGGDCILLELQLQVIPPMVIPAVEALLNAGLRVIVAHPERNPSLQRLPSFTSELVEMGCYLQLTAGSLTGSFGPEASAAANHLLKTRLAHFVASDAHGTERRRPLLSAARAAVSRAYDERTANLLFHDNPQAALNGSSIRHMPCQGAWFSRLFTRSSNGIRNQQIPA